MSDKKQSTEGLPMYVESLMTQVEWNQRIRDYPSSRLPYSILSVPKPNPFKWRYGMGKSLTQEEIDNINYNLDYIKKKAKIKTAENAKI